MEVSMNASEVLKNLIAGMTLRNSYWGYLFSRVRRIPDDNLRSIMGVSAEPGGVLGLRFHPFLVENTTEDQLAWVLEHEGMHVLNMHIPRLLRLIGDELDPKIANQKIEQWSKASDCCCNSQIKHFPQKIVINGRDWPALFPEKFGLENGLSAEKYFWEFMDEDNEKKKKGKQGKSNEGEDKEKGENGGKGESGDEKGQGPPQPGDGSPHGGFDSHEEWTGSEAENLDPHAMARRIETYTQDMVRKSVKNFNKNRGKLPGNIKDLINELLQPPKAPYYQIIRKLVVGSRLSKFKPSSTRINRKRTYVFNLGKDKLNIPQISPFPGKMRDRTFHIGILIDTSGSQSKDDLMEALSGIKNVVENDRHCKVTAIEIDTEIHKEYEVKKLTDIDFNLKGRGGTTLRKGLFRFNELKVDIMLAFSDGYCDNLNELSRKSIPKKSVWIIPEQGGTAEYVNRTGYVVRI